MWKVIFGTAGLLTGAFVGLEVLAWCFHNSFDGGGMAGIIIGVPSGAVAGCVLGVLFGVRTHRKGFPRLRVPHLLIAILVLTALTAIVVWMSTIRPFIWLQT